MTWFSFGIGTALSWLVAARLSDGVVSVPK
jgi:hypothetical protein